MQVVFAVILRAPGGHVAHHGIVAPIGIACSLYDWNAVLDPVRPFVLTAMLRIGFASGRIENIREERSIAPVVRSHGPGHTKPSRVC